MLLSRFTYACLLLLFVLNAVPQASAQDAASIRKDLEKNKQVLTMMDPANNRWHALRVAVNGNKDAHTTTRDYATEEYGAAWDFDTMPEKLKGQKHLKDLRVEGGFLKFTTEEDSEIFWGDHYLKNNDYGEECIGASWGSRWMPMFIRIRIRQSLPESDWVISMRPANGKLWQCRKKTFHLSGTEWQDVEMSISDTRSFMSSLNLHTKQAHNKVEIDSVSIYTPSLIRAYRTSVQIDGAVESAAFCVNTAPEYTVYINGQLACHEELDHQMISYLNRYTDMGRFFQKGKNEIVVLAEAKTWNGDCDEVILEGAVYETSGNMHLIKTDADWQGQYVGADGQVAETEWKPVRVAGKVTARFGENGYNGRGYFLNPPHYGLVTAAPFARKLPIFRAGEKIEFDVSVYGKSIKASSVLSYAVTDALAENAPVIAGDFADDCAAAAVKTRLSFLPPHHGVYNIKFILKEKESGTVLEEAEYEAVAVGKIEQKEIMGTSATEGLDLKLIKTIDCTKQEHDAPMFSGDSHAKDVSASVQKSAAGSYLTSGTGQHDLLSWKLDFPNHHRPFMVEVDYPDDARRIIGVSLGGNSYFEHINNDHGNREWPFAASGVYTGFQNPLTNTMQTLSMIVYPQMPVGTIDIVNYLSGSCAAVSAIRVYEINNDLPALKFGSKTARLTGVHAERITEIPNTFYNGDMDCIFADGQSLSKYPFHGFYKAWYITNRNLIKYMRFCGENTLVAGLVMYRSKMMYPSSAQDGVKADMAALMGEMFSANDLNLLLGIEYAITPEILQKNRITDSMMAEGKHSYFEVDKNGKQIVKWHKIANVNEQEVQDGLYESVKTLCDLYDHNPGVKGFVFQLGGSFHPTFPVEGDVDPLDSGYSDATVLAFERETGINIPVGLNDPERFQKRYSWLMKNAKDKWLKWRCDKVYEINHRLGTMIKRANPGWTMYLYTQNKVDDAFKNKIPFSDYQQHTGFWPPLYQDPLFCIGRYCNETIRHQSGDFGSYLNDQVYYSSDEIRGLFTDGMQRTAIRSGPQFYEPHLELPSEKWYWQRMLNGSYCLPTAENISRMYNRILYKETPYLFLQYWTDMNMACGFEQQRRLFNRAYSVLPEGKYETLHDNGLDSNCLIRICGDTFFIINLLPQPATFTLTCDDAANLVHLTTGETIPVKSSKAVISLAANGLDVYRLERGTLTAAASDTPQAIIDQCTKTSEELANRAQMIASKLAAGKVKPESVDDAKQFCRFAGEIGNDVTAEKYGNAYAVLMDYPAMRQFSIAKDLASPVNWLVIGPFANDGRKCFDYVYDVEKDLLSDIMEESYVGLADKSVRWQPVIARSAGEHRGIVNLMELYGEGCNYQIAYAFTQVYAPETTPVRLLLGSDDGLKVWINQKQVFTVKPERGLIPEENSAEAVLQKGWNRIVLKLENNVGSWGFAFDLKTMDGNDIPGLEYAYNHK